MRWNSMELISFTIVALDGTPWSYISSTIAASDGTP
jgi:hypothetical protein